MLRMFVLTVGLLAACSASAQLEWTALKHEQTAELGARQVVAEFAFTHARPVGEAGDEAKPIAITSIKPSCGCTTAELKQTAYAPGESGRIAVTFDLGARTGEQVKHIVVRTDHPDQPVVTLTMKVTIPDPVKITPKFVWWRADEPRTVKTLDLRIPEPPEAQDDDDVEPLRIVAARSLSDVVDVKLVTVEDGRHYRLEVTPAADTPGGRANIRIETDRLVEDDRPLIFWASARVLTVSSTPAANQPPDKELTTQ